MALSVAASKLTEHVTIADTAAALNVCTRTVRRMIACGELPAIRLGHRTVRIPATALDDYISRHTIPTVIRRWSDPIPPARNGIEWVDPTGNTAANNVDLSSAVAG